MTPTEPITADQITEIEQRLRSARGPWFTADCEGELEIWRTEVLRNVSYDQAGHITGYRRPAQYKRTDLIAEWALDTWDIGQDEDDDARRRIADLIGNAPRDLRLLLDEVRALREQVARVEEVLAKTGHWYTVRLGDQDVPVVPLPAIRQALDGGEPDAD